MSTEIITIAGLPGSGKSSTARLVAEKLGYRHFSSGDLFRSIARQHGWSIEEINFQAEKNAEIDYEVDEQLRSLGKERNLVIDSRTAFHWIPDSFKIYLKLDPKVAAERVFLHLQEAGRESQTGVSPEEVYEKTLARYTSENKRYQALYDLNPTDLSHYDLVLDTSLYSLEKVVDVIIGGYRDRLEK